MNWYKKAQVNDLNDELMDTQGLEAIKAVLNARKIPWREIAANQSSLLLFEIDNAKYVIDDYDFPSPKEASEWIWGLSTSNLSHYMSLRDFSETFWEEVAPNQKVYHATQPENTEAIRRDGLSPANASRGISNRGTPSAVFTSDNPHDIQSYGNAVFEINLWQMKQDGYTPFVNQESPLEEANRREALARLLGLEDFDASSSLHGEGIYPSTVVFFGKIPAKYLSVYAG